MTPTNRPAPLVPSHPKSRIARATYSLVRTTRQALGAIRISRPTIDPQLSRLSGLERLAEVLRYSLALAEHWLSPGGTLRAMLRVSLKLALFIGLPTLIVGPVVLLLLEGVAAGSALFATIAANLAALSFWLIAAVVGFAVLAALVRAMRRRE